MAADPTGCFELFLHQYKPASQRRPGHAEVPHTHRYWFTSLILRGGYRNRTFARERGWLRTRDAATLRVGDVLTCSPSDIHAIEGLEDGTVTFVVQSKPVRHYSEVFEDGRVTRYLDLEAQYAAFATQAER